MTKLLCLFLFSLSALAQPNLSGVWKPETASDQIMKIDQQGSRIDLSIRTPVSAATLHTIVGDETTSELNGIPVKSRAQWEGGTLVILLHAEANGNEIQVTDRYTLSSDGSKIESEETRKVSGQPDSSQKSVLVRRPAADWLVDTGLEPAGKGL